MYQQSEAIMICPIATPKKKLLRHVSTWPHSFVLVLSHTWSGMACHTIKTWKLTHFHLYFQLRLEILPLKFRWTF